ncbi:MAG: hypothetical protein HYS09_04730 [Chloroflexi bacterium]|nr:hypothetical protein [Chloroflexota bacterium]
MGLDEVLTLARRRGAQQARAPLVVSLSNHEQRSGGSSFDGLRMSGVDERREQPR